jgi:hypothetical protein
MGQYLFVLTVSWSFIYLRAVESLRELQKAMSSYRACPPARTPTLKNFLNLSVLSLPTQCEQPAERTGKSLVDRDRMALE